MIGTVVTLTDSHSCFPECESFWGMDVVPDLTHNLVLILSVCVDATVFTDFLIFGRKTGERRNRGLWYDGENDYRRRCDRCSRVVSTTLLQRKTCRVVAAKMAARCL